MPSASSSPVLGSTVEVSEIESLAKGSIIAGDGSGAPATLVVGSNDLPLVADSAQAAGLKYAALPVAGGGTGLTAGTSGGILGYTGTGTLASSILLTTNALVIGGGAGATPTPLGSLGTTTTLLHGNAAGAPTWAAVSLTADVSGILPTANGGTGIAFFTAAGPTVARVYTFPDAATTVLTTNAAVTVAQGGTGITSGTSGGILYFSATSTIASSGLLTANAIVLGGGAGTSPAVLGSLGTTTTVLHGNAAGAPTFAAVSLTADVSGILPGANGGTGNGFFAVSGPTTSLKTFTLPDASTTILTTNAAVTVAQGGTGLATATAYAVICGGTTGTGAFQSIAGVGTSGQVLTSNGAGALPTFQDGGAAWTGITAGSGVATTSNGDSSIVYQTAQTTASRLSWRFTESLAGVSTGTPVLLQVDTVAASTAIPLMVKSRASEVFRVSATTPQIGASAGTAAAPTYSFAFDLDTGIYSSVANTLDFTASGTSFLSMNSDTATLARATASTADYSLLFTKARGTVASPTVITTGDSLARIIASGYVGGVSQYVQAAALIFTSTGTISDSATGIGGEIDFQTRLVGAALASVFKISENKVGFFAVTPVVRPTAYTQTYATADKTHANLTSADIGAFTGGTVGFLDAAERDNVRTQYNALRADVTDLKQLVNSVIDDLQALGLVA